LQGIFGQLEDNTEGKVAEAVALITRVPGFGPIAAHEFADRITLLLSILTVGGLFSLNDLRKEPGLTPQQRLGLKYIEELEMKISLEEMHIWKVVAMCGLI
jgi:hypothetical protein